MTEILWLVPETPDSVSHGRSLIAERLGQRGYEVDVQQASLQAVRGDYDVLIGTTRKGGLLSPLASVSKPVIVDHVDPIEQFYKTDSYWLARTVDLGERLSFRVADHTLFVYSQEAERITGHATQTKLPVDVSLFENSPQTTVGERLQQRGISPGFAVYVGGLEPRYNITTLCRAASDTMRDWVIAGAGSLENHVERQAGEIPNLHYLGSLPHHQIPDLLRHAGVGVQLVDDAHTVTALEYGLARLPVVHLRGDAEKTLPSEVEFVENDWRSVATGVKRVRGVEMDSLYHYAKTHDVETVATHYQQAIRRVL